MWNKMGVSDRRGTRRGAVRNSRMISDQSIRQVCMLLIQDRREKSLIPATYERKVPRLKKRAT